MLSSLVVIGTGVNGPVYKGTCSCTETKDRSTLCSFAHPLARHTSSGGHAVALKKIAKVDGERSLETTLLVTLAVDDNGGTQCPFVIPLLRSWPEDGGLSCLLFPLARCSLSDYTATHFGTSQSVRRRYPDPAFIATIAAHLAGALAFVHSHGIVHRDVKPDNVLLFNAPPSLAVASPNDAIAVLADFGVARRITDASGLADPGASVDPLAVASTLVGTPQYMAPEMLVPATDGGTVNYGAPVDIWSLGILLIELCDGAPPLADMSPLQAMYTLVQERGPMTVRSSPPGGSWPRQLLSFVAKCVRRDPASRATAAQLLATVFVEDAAPTLPPLEDMTDELDETTPHPTPDARQAVPPPRPGLKPSRSSGKVRRAATVASGPPASSPSPAVGAPSSRGGTATFSLSTSHRRGTEPSLSRSARTRSRTPAQVAPTDKRALSSSSPPPSPRPSPPSTPSPRLTRSAAPSPSPSLVPSDDDNALARLLATQERHSTTTGFVLTVALPFAEAQKKFKVFGTDTVATVIQQVVTSLRKTGVLPTASAAAGPATQAGGGDVDGGGRFFSLCRDEASVPLGRELTLDHLGITASSSLVLVQLSASEVERRGSRAPAAVGRRSSAASGRSSGPTTLESSVSAGRRLTSRSTRRRSPVVVDVPLLVKVPSVKAVKKLTVSSDAPVAEVRARLQPWLEKRGVRSRDLANLHLWQGKVAVDDDALVASLLPTRPEVLPDAVADVELVMATRPA